MGRKGTCAVCGPTGNYYAKGFCGKHYTQNRLSNNPSAKETYRRKKVETHRLMTYGVTPEEYAQRLSAQHGLCAVCQTPSPGGRLKALAVDHDHVTGKVRGLLCAECNLGLGKFKDSAQLLIKAAEYLGNN